MMGVHSDTECTKVGVGILVEGSQGVMVEGSQGVLAEGSQSMMSDGMLVDE